MKTDERNNHAAEAPPREAAKPPKKTKSDRTRERLMAAARRVFARRGYIDAKIGEITAEAGIASGSFYNYFDDKTDLLRALIDDFWRALPHTRKALHGAALNPIAHLTQAVTQYWTDYVRHKAEIGGLLEAAMIDKSFARIWREMRSEGVPMTAADIGRAQKAGFAKGLEPEIAASALCCLVEFACYDWVGRKFDATGKKFTQQEMLRTLTELIARAIAYRGESPLAAFRKGRSTKEERSRK